MRTSVRTVNRPLSLWLETPAAARPAVRFEGAVLSYGELADVARRLAGLLRHRHGLRAGARVAYLGHNTPEQLALLFACARAGLMLVPLNWRLAPAEIETIFADAGPACLVVDGACLPLVTPAMLGNCGGNLYSVRAPGAPYPDLLATLHSEPPPAPPLGAEDDPLLLVYTSGTTGRPKGSVLTQGALHANAANAVHMHDLTASDHVLTSLPMFHVGGLNIQTTPALYVGACVTLLPRFDPAATLAAIGRARPTLTVQVPATLQALLAAPEFATSDLASLRAIATGSTDVPVELMVAFHARGVPVIQVYGATETAPLAIYQRIPDALATIGAIGRPGLHTEIRLVDHDGAEVAPGLPGEILVRGPHVAREYWRDPDATATAFRDGWFHSGDVAVCDAAGVYWFRDRIKNVIISGGENIYPAEIERIARAVPGITEVAVVGRFDPRWGQVPVLVAVPGAMGLDRAGLMAAFDASLARYKHPKAILEVDALPRTALGKVDVGALRAMVARDR